MIEFFTDPVLRAPTLGSMLMCLASSLVGVIVFLRKRSLIGETLSHAAYPGVVLSIGVASLLPEEIFPIAVLAGAFATSLLGLKTVDILERKFRVKSDAALTFVLSFFFSIGILVASRFQTTHSLWYKQAEMFLFGQTATMTDIHIVIYGILAIFIIAFIVATFRHLEATNFDRSFAETLGIRCQTIDHASFLLLALAIVIGIRSCGVVLMAGMLIAPAASARLFSKRLSHHFLLAAVFGLAAGFIGNFLSIRLPQGTYVLPTGPTILLSAALLCLLSLLFAPKQGLFSRLFRRLRFHHECQMENGLKALWKGKKVEFPFLIYFHLRFRGLLDKHKILTSEGRQRAEKIVRLHRLWEVYLVDYLGQRAEKVHRNAEELEHLLTPDLEHALTELLHDPKLDPHHQPIPPGPPRTLL
jgi:manganese/zinc/iron transport system permease protein